VELIGLGNKAKKKRQREDGAMLQVLVSSPWALGSAVNRCSLLLGVHLRAMDCVRAPIHLGVILCAGKSGEENV